MKLLSAMLVVPVAWAAGPYYLDCVAGNDAADGRSEETAWKTARTVSAHRFGPGDRILLKRGTQCSGPLWPKGSGSAEAPIVLDAYGDGPLPLVSVEAGAEAAFRLFDQEYWTVQHVEFSGGQPHGVYVSGTKGVLHGIHLRELVVHGVTGEPENKEGGLVVVAPGSASQRFDDVLVEGVTAYGTSQWAGILVGGVEFGFLPEQARSTNVMIRNSTVHDVAGDGILLFQVNRGAIEDSVAWYTGMQKTQTIGTPNGIWTWMCGHCAVRRCEAFLTDSSGVDGGAFDIDYGDSDNVVEDSYGHDTQGYCVAIFGAGQVTIDSVVRRNVCAANGRSPRLAALQGAVFLSTWDGGRLKGVEISENRIIWQPPVAAAALVNIAEFEGSGVFENNTIETRVAEPIRSNGPLKIALNRIQKIDAPRLASQPGRWQLYGVSQDAIITSAYRQFHAAGLERVATEPAGSSGMKLVNPAGEVVWRHQGPVAPGDLGLALRAHLGEPDYTQLISER